MNLEPTRPAGPLLPGGRPCTENSPDLGRSSHPSDGAAHTPDLAAAMVRAVDACTAHVEGGGLPFAGLVVNPSGKPVSAIGVNRVAETGDVTAHAEIVAMRDAMSSHGLDDLAGHILLATGEPCGMCWRHAFDLGISAVHVAVDRDDVASFGFDYRASYRAFGITDARRAEFLHLLPVPRGSEPFTRYLDLHLFHHPDGQELKGRRGPAPKGTSS